MDNLERLRLEAELQNPTFAAEFLSNAYQQRFTAPDNEHCNKEFLQAIGTLIRASRQSIPAVALKTGISREHIYKLIRGQKNPTVNTLSVLLAEVGLTIKFVPSAESSKTTL
jgi:DNA-binding phage protein